MSPGARRRAAGERLSDGRRRRFVARIRCAGLGGRATRPNPRPTDPVFPRIGARLVPRRRLRARSPRAPAAGCRRSVSGGRGHRFAGRTRRAPLGGGAPRPNPRPTNPVFPASAPGSFRAGAPPPRCPRGRGGGLPARGCRMDGDAGSSPGSGAQDSAVERRDRIRDRRTRCSPASAPGSFRAGDSARGPRGRRRRAAGGASRAGGDAGSPAGPGAQASADGRRDRIRDRLHRPSPPPDSTRSAVTPGCRRRESRAGARVSPSRPGAPAEEERRHGIRDRRGRCSPRSAPPPGRAPGLHPFRAVESAPGPRGRGGGRRPG